MAEEKKRIPKRRFEEFQNAGEWEQRKLSESYKFSQGLQVSVEEQFNNCLDGFERFIRIVDVTKSNEPLRYIQNITGKGRVTNDDIFFVRYGAVGTVGYGFSGTIANNLFVLTPLIKVNSQFMFQQFSATEFNTKLTEMSASTSMPAINFGALNNMMFWYPSIEEQTKIGHFFKTLDNLISLHQRKLDKIKSLKKAYLSEMFPAKGESKPKRRFKGFSRDWELRKLLDNVIKVIDFRGRTPKKLGMDWSGDGYLALSALNVKNGFIDESIDAHYGNQELYDKWMTGNELHQGQVLFTTEAPMGNVAQVPDNKGYILSQRTIAFEVKKDLITENYLAIVLRSPKSYSTLTSLSSGGTAKGVSQKSLSELHILVPRDLKEQEKIGAFFKDIDNIITLHQQKLDKLKNLKKSYLNEMFV